MRISKKILLKRAAVSSGYLLAIGLIVLYYQKREIEIGYNQFNASYPSSTGDYFYKDETESLGINHKTENFIPSEQMKNYIAMAPAVNYVAVADFNKDTFADLMFTTGNPQRPIIIYQSNQGNSFEDKTNSIGLAVESKKRGIIHAAAFFDFNNDGWQDIYLARDGCHEVYINNKGMFASVSESFGEARLCNLRVTGINVFDYNNDGYPDLFLTRLYGEDPSSGGDTGNHFYIPKVSKSFSGKNNQNILLKNLNGKSLERIKTVAGKGILTWAAGFSDINDDGLPDIITANDFSLNRIFINNKEGQFAEATAKYLGDQYQSGNMSVEVGDVFNKNSLDLFISNISRSTYSVHTHNYLFQRTGPNRFEDISKDIGIDKCGWAWGAKFIDPNLDGRLDLVVSNGFFDRGKKDYYYKWIVFAALPAWLTENSMVLPPTEGHSLASAQRNCLFEQQTDSKFKDVATDVGLTDLFNSRGLAAVDLKNQGRFDIVIANTNEKPIVYKHYLRENNKNNWIGLILEGTKSNKFGIGAKVKIRAEKFNRIYEHFPTNGFSAQSDSKILIGLADSNTVSIEIMWPSGITQHINDLEINKYHQVLEKDETTH